MPLLFFKKERERTTKKQTKNSAPAPIPAPAKPHYLGQWIYDKIFLTILKIILIFTKCLYSSCEELTLWKRLWCWEGLGAGGEGDDRGWDGWMASSPWWTWVWVNSGSWWWTERPGVLRFMGSQRVGHDWVTELSWTELYSSYFFMFLDNLQYFENIQQQR